MKQRLSPDDRRLGLGRAIDRRDFLQGAALLPLALGGCGAGTATDGAAPPAVAAQDRPGYYPPLLAGLRGSHPGSFEAAHAMRDGQRWAAPTLTGETYDLVVVGSGLSGLAAAQFYRDHAGSAARVLLLDNHDDFGGHARRNEFAGTAQVLFGGSMSIESPRPYGPVARGLLQALGIGIEELATTLEDHEFYGRRGLGEAVFFDAATFGSDRLVRRDDARGLSVFLAEAPLSAAARRDIQRIETDRADPLPGWSSSRKKEHLARLSYRSFLLDVLKASPEVLPYYQKMTHPLYCVGIDAVSALDCWATGLPGFQGLSLAPGSIPRMGYTAAGLADNGGEWSTTVHFPDGNATLARALVRRLVPDAVPGGTLADLLTARVDYAKLDAGASPVRIRLNSTVVAVKNLGPAKAPTGVAVTYVRDGQAAQVTARHCVLACWNAVIPHLCPDLPAPQREALAAPEKTPLVYTSVALRDWQAFDRLKVSEVYAPGSFFSTFRLNPVTRLGPYAPVVDPARPTLLHLQHAPCAPGLTEREQNRAGRTALLATPFETFERELRGLLGRALGGGGFDPARDITGITVNRWPHGYAHEYNPLFDPLLPEAQQPHVIGRARFGRIAIANSDAGAAAYADSALDQAHRAVGELLGSPPATRG